jgi:hypothetical protein
MDVRLESLTSLDDDQLLFTVSTLAAQERRATVRLIAALAELERRRLYLAQGCASLFTYCTQVLQLSEDAAYNRMVVARAVLTFPVILTRLDAGDVTLTAVRRLVPVLTFENVEQLLAAARRKSKREVEHLVAAVRPSADVATVVRRVPAPPQSPVPPARPLWFDDSRETSGQGVAPATGTPRVAFTATPAADASASSRPAVLAPLAPDRYKVQFTASRDTYDKLQRARDLLRHVIPDGDPAAVFDRALDALLADLFKRKLAATGCARPQSAAGGTRYIPAAVRREVWKRDAARCAFVGHGGRCTERGFLELHHVTPFADGGQATVDNIELRCRAHNAFESEQYFGSFVLREWQPVYGSFRNE